MEAAADKSQKTRLTLYLEERVKVELKKQAEDCGVSMSAYISMLVMNKKTND